MRFAPSSAARPSRIGAGDRNVRLRQRERDRRSTVLGDVLDDHVDVDARPREVAKHLRGDARPVGDADDRHLRLGGVVGDPGDDRLLEHYLVLLADPGSFAVRERRANAELHTVATGNLDRAQRHHLRSGRGHLEHLLVGDLVELQRGGHDARVGGEDARDVREDLACVGAERGGQRDGGRVRAAAAERRHVVRRGRDALEAGDEHDLVLLQRRVDPLRAHLDDLRLRVAPVRHDPGLGAGERHGLVPEVVDRHRAQCVRDPLAGRDEHVVLTRVRPIRDLVREPDQLVRRLAHRREHRDDLRAGLPGRDEALRDALQLVRVADGRAAELHDDEPGRPAPRLDGRHRFEMDSRHLRQCRQR